MTGRFFGRDIDAPNTNWRPGSEDPLPYLFSRFPGAGFAYRFVTGRPLDGHARTDASFWHPGTVAFTKSGRAMPYQFWPGWKRGLLITRLPAFGMLPYSAVAIGADKLMDTPWWLSWEAGAAAWLPHLTYAGVKSYVGIRDHGHNKHVIRPITAAAMNILRSREVRVDIPRDVVGSSVPRPDAGKVWLPVAWTGGDADRDSLQEMLTDRLRAPVSLSFDMSGRTPSVSLSVPKQPPKRVPWDMAVPLADSVSPYLGDSASGHVHWDRQDDSPHIAILGGSGSGKSEIMAWIVAQIMRGGAGIIVLDPKVTSHRWLMNRREVLYCGERAMLHDTIIWLDSELTRRANANRAAARDLDFPQLLILLEERNSLQDLLRDHWYDIKATGDRAKSPALVALDRLNSMGRSLGITVLLAGQESASQAIGSRANYGSFAIAGRMAPNHYKNIGVAKKPAITAGPGRMAYVVAGGAQVFQAAWPDVKGHPDRLWEWATSGEALLDVPALMTQGEAAAFPSSSPGSGGSGAPTVPFVTLAEYVLGHPGGPTIEALRMARKRAADFPAPASEAGGTHRYNEETLHAWVERRQAKVG